MSRSVPSFPDAQSCARICPVQIDARPFRDLELEAYGGDAVDYPIADTPGFVRRDFLHQLPVKRNEIQGRLGRWLWAVGKEDRFGQLRSAGFRIEYQPPATARLASDDCYHLGFLLRPNLHRNPEDTLRFSQARDPYNRP